LQETITEITKRLGKNRLWTAVYKLLFITCS
jgi:hypothetical protein